MDRITSRFYLSEALDLLHEFGVEDNISTLGIGFVHLLQEILLYTFNVYRSLRQFVEQ